MSLNGSPPHVIRAVVFDWRGTLVSELTPQGWAREALQRAGRESHADAVNKVLLDIKVAAGQPNRLQSPQGNISYEAHRDTYYAVFTDAKLPSEVADALFEVDSDASLNKFAVDAAATLIALKQSGYKICVLSNIHFDIRPVFKDANLLDLIDTFVLSNEEGVQKPDPAIFERALEKLRTCAAETLMVGDRPSRDGVAVEVGMPTLLVPALTDPQQRRLHLVTSAVGVDLGMLPPVQNDSMPDARKGIPDSRRQGALT
ncbi:HAD family hydrolase [Nocardia suismassiliense]|uniref:HAD family hydrolase n=1 Tax=Nocardia suismassiliense TaxID=2077092 RepID=UPI0018FE5A2D|nr:HAD family hydrolase [Nocardia suismassiliense]